MRRSCVCRGHLVFYSPDLSTQGRCCQGAGLHAQHRNRWPLPLHGWLAFVLFACGARAAPAAPPADMPGMSWESIKALPDFSGPWNLIGSADNPRAPEPTGSAVAACRAEDCRRGRGGGTRRRGSGHDRPGNDLLPAAALFWLQQERQHRLLRDPVHARPGHGDERAGTDPPHPADRRDASGPIPKRPTPAPHTVTGKGALWSWKRKA